MLFAARRLGPPLPLLWRVFLTNAAMPTLAAWARAELTLALAASGTDRAQLSSLRSASPRYQQTWDWLLGMRPAAMVAGPARVVSVERSS